VLVARTSGGAQVLAVQYRNTAANPRQVRLVTGSSPASAWLNIAAGVTDLRIDRSAAGSVTLSANGVQVQGPFASTGTVANVRLGIVSGTVSSGSIQLDSFGATS
jgi:hypothetical protein